MKQANDEQSNVATLGLWVYLMTDLVLFASLFATFIVLRHNTAGGPAASELFDMPYILIETFVLLFSSLMCGLAFLSAKFNKRRAMLMYLVLTILLGAVFLGMELYEFSKLASEGHSWAESAFLSSYFTLVGTHGLHISVGLLWAVVLLVRLVRRPLEHHVLRKLGLFAIFWHFLELVWIFIFSVVYLIGGTL
jgi:cytochrome o ubiquinol oxidase subunit 3